MADKDNPTLPSSGRPSKASLDERTAELEARESALNEREADLNAQFEARPRTTTDEVAQREHGNNPKSIRRGMGAAKRLDADKYIAIHQDKQLLWVNDLNGDVQRWIDVGAEPVPVANVTNRTFEGITDKTETKWVRAMGGSDGEGNHFWVYLLMIEPALYDEVKLAPIRERQDLIRRAMRLGSDQSDYGEGPKLPSYAPNLPDGGTGYSETHEVVG